MHTYLYTYTNRPMIIYLHTLVYMYILIYIRRNNSIYIFIQTNMDECVFMCVCMPIFHIIGICPWTSIATTSHRYVPLCYFCSLHIHQILMQRLVQKMQLLIIMLLPHVTITIISLKYHIYTTFPNNFMCTWNNYVSIYTTYEFTAINNVTRSTGIHTFPIIGICHWTNMPSKLLMNVALLCCCSLHINLTILYI